MGEWQYYRIKSKVLARNHKISVIDILSNELDCNQEDIEWIREGD